MKRFVYLSLSAALITILAGCAHYGYSHRAREIPVYPGSPMWWTSVGTNKTVQGPIVVKETRDRAGGDMVLVNSKASQVFSKTVDGEYDKTLTVGDISTTVDDVGLKLLADGIGQIAGEAFRSAAGLPPLPIPSASALLPTAVESTATPGSTNTPPATLAAPATAQQKIIEGLKRLIKK